MSVSRILRIGFGLAAALFVLRLTGPPSRAQSTAITFDKFNSGAWPAGPDYATDVLGDAWDFSNVQDVDPYEDVFAGWASFSVANGLAGGRTAPVNGFYYSTMGLLYSGYYDSVTIGRSGRRFPIDSSRYQKFGLRMTSSVGGGAPQIYWFHYPWGDPRDPVGGGNGVKQIGTIAAGAQIFTADFSGTPTAGTRWTDDVVVGMRFDRNGSNQDADIHYDWARLTVKDSDPAAAMQTIRWTFGTGQATVKVIDAQGTALTIGSGLGGTSLTWNYGVLPPGTYTLQVTRGGETQSRPFTINAPPMIALTEPNETGGEDFATTVLSNAWDMNDPSDVQITGWELITPPVFSGGVMSSANYSGQPADFFLLANSNNGVPIDTSRYRYFTIRFQVDGDFDLGMGSVARVLWSSHPSSFGGTTATTTKSFLVWEGMNTYTIDLSSLTLARDDGLENLGSREEWTAAAKRFLNFHPHEFLSARTFRVDYVKLAAMAETVNGSFTLKWAGGDANGGNPAVALYYDNDTNPSNGKTLIASSLSMSAGQHFWDAASVPPGEYWIYAEANDGVQTYGRYSTGPLRVIRSGPVSQPVMVVDTPADPSTVAVPFPISGWAVDTGASSGVGVDAVHVWALPTSGAPGTFLGAANLAGRRDDVGAYFGSQFTYSGYNLSATSLAAGSYKLHVFARSTVTGTFNQVRVIGITVRAATPDPLMVIDTPAWGATISPTFTVAGWAVDRGAPTGTGVSAVHVWAFPASGAAPVWLGAASYGLSRPDVAAGLGDSRFTNSGYTLSASLASRPRGAYDVVTFMYSTLTSSFSHARVARVTVQ